MVMYYSEFLGLADQIDDDDMVTKEDKTKYIILGIGLNVNTKKADLVKGATSIKEELGKKVSRVEMAKQILRELDKLYLAFKSKGFDIVITEWRDLSTTLGCRVKVHRQNKKIEGQAMDVDSSGALVVRLDSGFIEHISAGDVSVVR